ncbi:helix-turn-helix domain-containing protein [Acidovorax sp. SUPP2825]|uniref:IclR family transcriptional regulator n=1 Tax=Acidovorax sp. SUPP2825 TaxID=2920879 RepID=UPI0023DE280D|nr:helix-turn-helix domain-containing protein [Acidovorax sp. SUPP2825]GKS93808.1 helix-turn-helix domain-containing protein [Acidovorax sp. SUPP2825]
MPASTVKSATRVLQVLEYFAQVRTPLPLKRISEALGYPQSSTTVLLKNLIAMGYLRYDRTERLYFPTPRVTSLGDWISQALFGQGRIFELMHDLHGATGETVSIAMLNDIYVQYIRVIQSTHAIRFHTDEGSLRPLTRSAVGWLLLTDRTDAEVEKLVHRANIAVQGREDRVPLETIAPEVAGARLRKALYLENLPLLGGATIGVVMPWRVQGRLVVLGMGGTIERMRPHRARYTALMRRLALQLEQPQPGPGHA